MERSTVYSYSTIGKTLLLVHRRLHSALIKHTSGLILTEPQNRGLLPLIFTRCTPDSRR